MGARSLCCSDAAGVSPATKEKDATAQILRWLRSHGVSRRKARQFLIRSGCDCLATMALYLRFQLPPLHFSNTDSVNTEMYDLFGVGGRNARRIIADLDVLNAINTDMNQEATAHMSNTGSMAPAMASKSGRYSTTSPPVSGGVDIPRPLMPASPPRSITTAVHMHAVAECAENSSPGMPRAPSMDLAGEFDPPRDNVIPPPSARGAAAVGESREPSQDHWTHNSLALAGLPANDTCEARLGSTDPAPPASYHDSFFVLHAPHPSDGSSHAAGRPANPDAPPGFVGNPPPGSAAVVFAPPQSCDPPAPQGPYATLGNPVGSPVAGSGRFQVNAPRSGGAMSGPTAAAPLSPHVQRSPMSVRSGKSSRGFTGPMSSYDGFSAPMFPAYDTPGNSQPHRFGDDPDISVDLLPASPAGLTVATQASGASRKLPGLPTVSTAMEPGPYHRANALFRKLQPHYTAHISVNTRWDHIIAWVLALLIMLIYLGTRVFYVVSGRTSGFNAQNTSVAYSWVVLAAEFGLGFLGLYGHQLFWKQEVRHDILEADSVKQIAKEVKESGVCLTVNVLITTYTEPAETVRECLVRLLVAPEPIYMEKRIYICDDGHAKSEGPKKRAMVEELRVLGHTNVYYIGDRVKRPGQLNGKSANINHCILRKIYPNVRRPSEVPAKDVFMVVDCDHMVKPEVFGKMAPCMLDEKVAVTLLPQHFHNLIKPDLFDAANADFMLSKMPYCFGAGMCYITGTNVMIRARAAFKVCKFSESNKDAGAVESGLDYRQIYAEDEISEDIDLGARMHAAGYKSVFIQARLATGEVPLDLRAMWRQRLRWLKGGHLFILSPNSVFFSRKKNPHFSFYQKALYWLCPVAHFIQLWAEPIIFTSPFMCLVMEICPYGMDSVLFWTHLAHFFGQVMHSTYRRELDRTITSWQAKVGYRVLWFTSVKACINTIMVHTGWKNPGIFKFTPKAGVLSDEAEVSGVLAVSGEGESNSLSVAAEKHVASEKETEERTDAKEGKPKKNGSKRKAKKDKFELRQVHAALSKVTETRRICMPLNGTFDFWVLLIFTGLSLFTVGIGTKDLLDKNALVDWDIEQNDSIRWISVVFALSEASPGLLFFGYAAVYDCAPWLLKIWVPLVCIFIGTCIIGIEGRVAYFFITGD